MIDAVDGHARSVATYDRFCLSCRAGEERLFARGISVTDEAVRKWCRKFGQPSAPQLRRRRPRPGATWHPAEVCLTIHGERHCLWRAVDQAGHGLDMLVPSRRQKNAAKKFFRKLLQGCLMCHGSSSPTSSTALGRRSERASSQQPRRTLSPTDAPAGAAPAGVQVPQTGPSLNPSARDATGSRPPSIAKRGPTESRSGGRSRARRRPHQGHVRQSSHTSTPGDDLCLNTLILP
jgi:DDE domain